MSTSTEFSVDIEAQLLNELVQPALVLTQDSNAVFRWHEDCVEVGNVDGANTIKIHQKINAEQFDSYDLDSDGYSIGVKCDRLSNILDSLKSTETVSLTVDTENNEISIKFDQGQYGMAGVRVDAIREPNKSDLTHDVDIRIHKSAIDQAYNIIGMVSEQIVIEVADSVTRFSGQGDADNATISLSATTEDGDLDSDEVFYETPVLTTVKSKYSKNLIDDLRKFVPNSHIRLEMADNQPLEVSTKRADGRIETQIVVAPKVTP